MPYRTNADPSAAIFYLFLAAVCALVFPVFHRQRLIRAVESGKPCADLHFSTRLEAQEILQRLNTGSPDSLLACHAQHGRLTFRIVSGKKRTLPFRHYDYSIEFSPGSILLRRLPGSHTLGLLSLKQFLNQTLR